MTVADLYSWFEDRRGDISLRVFDKVRSIARLVGTRYEEIKIAIAFASHRQRSGPKPYSQIDDRSRIVIFERLEAVVRV